MPKARLGSGLRMQHLVQHVRSEPPAVKVANALRRFAVAKAKTLGGKDGEAKSRYRTDLP